MAFFIYENWQAGPHKAVLHTGTCGSCKEGRGLAGGSDPSHGQWHGPYATLEDARAAQNQLTVQVRKDCRCIGTVE